MISKLAPAAGKLLISEPFMDDPDFTRSVIFITEHTEEGTIGFILNHPSIHILKDVVPDIIGPDFPIYLGGPVDLNSLHFIHRCPEKIPGGGREIAKGIYWGGDYHALRTLIERGEVNTSELKFFFGYSGWEDEQLQTEVEGNSWIVSDQYDADLIFSEGQDQLWKEVIVHLGPKYAHLINFPQSPRLN